MALLSREEILNKQDRSYKDVKCPEWGGTVRIQSLSGAERDAFEESIMGPKAKDGTREVSMQNFRAKLVAMTAVDKEGNQLFSKDDVLVLGQKNAAALDRCFGVAQKLSGISKDDVSDMVGNSEAGQSAGSTFDSPST